MSKLNKIIGWAVYNFFKKGFEENGHSITLIVDEKSIVSYGNNSQKELIFSYLKRFRQKTKVYEYNS